MCLVPCRALSARFQNRAIISISPAAVQVSPWQPGGSKGISPVALRFLFGRYGTRGSRSRQCTEDTLICANIWSYNLLLLLLFLLWLWVVQLGWRIEAKNVSIAYFKGPAIWVYVCGYIWFRVTLFTAWYGSPLTLKSGNLIRIN